MNKKIESNQLNYEKLKERYDELVSILKRNI